VNSVWNNDQLRQLPSKALQFCGFELRCQMNGGSLIDVRFLDHRILVVLASELRRLIRSLINMPLGERTYGMQPYVPHELPPTSATEKLNEDAPYRVYRSRSPAHYPAPVPNKVSSKQRGQGKYGLGALPGISIGTGLFRALSTFVVKTSTSCPL